MTILQGDSTTVLKDINDESIDLIVTDPPYFLINDSGSGFMGKQWDSINDRIGLDILCKSKEFANYVLKFFQLTTVEQSLDVVNSAQLNVKTKDLENQQLLLKSNAQHVAYHSTNGSQASKVNINSVPDYVLTKHDLLDLLSELSINHTTVLERLPETALFVIPYSYIRKRIKGTVAENVLKLPTDLQCEDQQIQVSSMDEIKINHVIEAMIGSVLDCKSTKEMDIVVDYAADIVEGRKYKHIILSNTNRLKTIHSIIWLLYVINVMQRRNIIPNSYTINSDLIYQFHKSWAREGYRVLKQGKLAFVMCSPRQDIIHITIQAFEDVGFKAAYTSIFHTFASGFPKAKNNKDGSYVNFSPKPAVEVILVISKGKTLTWLDDCRIPFSGEKEINKMRHTISEGSKFQFNEPGNGWDRPWRYDPEKVAGRRERNLDAIDTAIEKGRFPANLLVSDDVLNDGNIRPKSGRPNSIGKVYEPKREVYGKYNSASFTGNYNDTGSYSRYFDLDKWYDNRQKQIKRGLAANPERSNYNGQYTWTNHKSGRHYPDNQKSKSTIETFPFIITPKASKSEKNKGCEKLPLRTRAEIDKMMGGQVNMLTGSGNPRTREFTNNHPTIKPVKLFSYLITMGSRENDLILDPFCGSGTTLIAAHNLHRKYIGIEINKDYIEIAKHRLNPYLQQTRLTMREYIV